MAEVSLSDRKLQAVTLLNSCVCPPSVQVRLLNYKANGEPFYNSLHVAPIRNSSGKVSQSTWEPMYERGALFLEPRLSSPQPLCLVSKAFKLCSNLCMELNSCRAHYSGATALHILFLCFQSWTYPCPQQAVVPDTEHVWYPTERTWSFLYASTK